MKEVSDREDYALYTITPENLNGIIQQLTKAGYTVYGPVVKDGVIIYDTIESISQLPVGFHDAQAPGYYRLEKRDDNAFFGHVVGPQSWKKILYPSRVKLYTITEAGDVQLFGEEKKLIAFIGVRSCELHAIGVLDKVLLGGKYKDPVYMNNRRNVFIIAVNCTEPGANCFCSSTGTGPEAMNGYDICLTEVVSQERQYFIAQPGTEKGLRLLRDCEAREARQEEVEKAQELMNIAHSKFRKNIMIEGLRDRVLQGFDNSFWSDVAERCLACGNCTLVCPTCFCTTVEDINSIDLSKAERWRRWDSCFTADFSYIHGGVIRSSVGSRYRQWFMHKLVTWVDQFGLLGCVGCGRCITWCPVGIDITEEAAKLGEAGEKT